MSAYLKIGPQTRILKSAIIGVEVRERTSDLFLQKFGVEVTDDGMVEIRFLLNTGKNVRTRVKQEDVDLHLQPIYDALGWF